MKADHLVQSEPTGTALEVERRIKELTAGAPLNVRIIQKQELTK